MCNLIDMQPGQQALIASINGNHQLITRVGAIGLYLGCQIQMLHNEKNLPLLIFSRDTVIAINRQIGQAIHVEVGV